MDPLGRDLHGIKGDSQLDSIEAEILNRGARSNVRGRTSRANDVTMSMTMSKKPDYPYDELTPADAIMDQEVALHDQAQIVLLKKVIKQR